MQYMYIAACYSHETFSLHRVPQVCLQRTGAEVRDKVVGALLEGKWHSLFLPTSVGSWLVGEERASSPLANRRGPSWKSPGSRPRMEIPTSSCSPSGAHRSRSTMPSSWLRRRLRYWVFLFWDSREIQTKQQQLDASQNDHITHGLS